MTMALNNAKSGRFYPKNPQKYSGDPNNIIYRSLLERNLMSYFDKNPNILKWASEEIFISYYNQLDQKHHRYFPDFIIEYIDKNTQVKKMLIEVKPYLQTIEPKPKKNKKTMLFETTTWITNNAKWSAAREWCSKNNIEFKILTEKHIKPQYNKQ